MDARVVRRAGCGLEQRLRHRPGAWTPI
jgi:hypothetical protein